MSNKLICIILLILFIILLLLIIYKRNNNIESFRSSTEAIEDRNKSVSYRSSSKSTTDKNKSVSEPSSESTDKSVSGSSNKSSNKWTTNKDKLAAENELLNDAQVNQVKNMITSISQSQLKTLITTQSPLLTGPAGPQGPQGPAGTQLIASGRLINKSGSFNNNSESDKNFLLPQYVVTRTKGTSPTSSLSFMDNVSPFGSFQNWQLDINNNIKNRYDDTCLTMNATQDKLYMSKCEDSPTQKWTWDNSNRIVSTTLSTNQKLKCVGLTKPEVNVLTTNIPNCNDADCMANTARRYLVVKDCDINNINQDELWAFV
jgi:hypothetical protein